MSELLVIVLGFCGGVVAGMLGVGGGIIFVPSLVIFLDDTQLEAESTSLLAIVPVAIAGVIRQRGYGNVRMREGITIGLLSIPGVAIGVGVSNAVPQRALEIGFACLLLFVAGQLVLRALRQRPAEPAPPDPADA